MEGYFDLETTGLGPDAKITVGVVKLVDPDGSSTHEVFHSGYGTVLGAVDADRLLDVLLGCTGGVYSFNGAGFDFRVLSDAVTEARRADVRRLAGAHMDVMLDFSASHGYYAALSSFLGPAVSKSNTGEWAATAWFQGCGEEVEAYCKTDVDVLAGLVLSGRTDGYLERKTRAGRTQRWVLDGACDGKPRFRSASAALDAWATSPPKVDWMSNPPDIGSTLSWAF